MTEWSREWKNTLKLGEINVEVKSVVQKNSIVGGWVLGGGCVLLGNSELFEIEPSMFEIQPFEFGVYYKIDNLVRKKKGPFGKAWTM